MWIKSLVASIFLVVTLSLGGCSVTPGSADSNLGEALTKTAVIGGTWKLIDGDANKQEKVAIISAKIIHYLEENPEIDPSLISDFMLTLIPWDKLRLEERLLAETLFTLIQDEIKDRIAIGAIPKDVLLRIKTIVGWINTAAITAQ